MVNWERPQIAEEEDDEGESAIALNGNTNIENPEMARKVYPKLQQIWIGGIRAKF